MVCLWGLNLYDTIVSRRIDIADMILGVEPPWGGIDLILDPLQSLLLTTPALSSVAFLTVPTQHTEQFGF